MTITDESAPAGLGIVSQSFVRAGDTFSLGWTYDNQQDYITLRALKDFDLREISERLLTGYAPRTTVRQHLDHLSQVLLREAYASTEVCLVHFAFDGEGGDDVVDLPASHFYRGHRR